MLHTVNILLHFTHIQNFRPSDFSDIVAKNVSKIQWQEIIESTSALDIDDQEKATDDNDVKAAEKDLMAFDAVREAAKDRSEQ